MVKITRAKKIWIFQEVLAQYSLKMSMFYPKVLLSMQEIGI